MNAAVKIDWVDRLPATLWLALSVVALTPVWLWSAARLLDRSDDPLGIVALAALAVLVARDRRRFAGQPRVGWLIVTTALAAVVLLGGAALPALLRGVLAVLAVCAMLMAVRAPAQPMLALTGLALLALPLLSSLQFFIGYPLRVVTGEASRWLLLAGGVDAARDGAALTVAGRLVMVDAPCSGIQMGWVSYFSACVTAAWWRVPDGRFLRRLPLVGLAVLCGNIVRNTLLVVKDAALVQWPDWTHEAIGVAAFALVCALVVWHVRDAGGARVITWEIRLLRRPAAAVSARTWGRLASLVVLGILTLWPWLKPEPVVASTTPRTIEWPRELEGRALRPLALSAVEQRFAERFPGAIARFTDGERTVVLRRIAAPTRMLHPATDCYRGLGYRIVSSGLEREVESPARAIPAVWRCFIAEKNGLRVRVCETILDPRGGSFSDTSAWYWAAVTGRSQGPWEAVTKARIL